MPACRFCASRTLGQREIDHLLGVKHVVLDCRKALVGTGVGQSPLFEDDQGSGNGSLLSYRLCVTQMAKLSPNFIP